MSRRCRLGITSRGASPKLAQDRGSESAFANEDPKEGDAHSPELYFGLVNAVGTDSEMLNVAVAASLRDFRYDPVEIRLSALLKDLDPSWSPREAYEDERYEDFMDAGDRLRRRTGRADALAILGIQKIVAERAKVTGSDNAPASRRVFIIRGLKTPDEVSTLREVYGGGFFVVAAYAPMQAREKRLAEEIAKSHKIKLDDATHRRARIILERDEKDGSTKWGQNVRETFPLADLFVDATADNDTIQREVDRFVALIHGHEFLTPRKVEYGMYMAKSASLRSAELGRQVGAAICDQDGEVVSLGANELPR